MPAVYETIRVRHGSIPFLEQHLVRMEANCSALGLPPPVRLREAILDAQTVAEERLRITWDGGELRVTSLALIAIASMHVRTVTQVHGGYRVKTTDRIVFDRARAEARDAGADEGLLLTTEGFVAEGTLFAVGWFDGDVLCAPSLDLGILPSIGRNRVLEVAKKMGYQIHEGFFKRSELDARPVFATTSTRGVVEISVLDGNTVPGDPRVDELATWFWPE